MSPSLERWQAQFAAALLADDASRTAFAPTLADDARTPAALALYRRHVSAACGHALAAAYPVVHALVGAECFAALAVRYAAQHPSVSGDLTHFGAQLPEFLVGHAPTQHLAYLADVALLERAVHRAYYAADAAPLPRERVAALSPAQLLASRFRLDPACGAFAFAHAACSIWQAHQPAAEIALCAIAPQREFALVARRGWEVAVVRIAPGEFAALEALRAGCDMDDTIAAALAADRGFDFAKSFLRWLELDVFVGLDG